MERWMPVKGYENSYVISDKGNIISIRSGRELKQQKDKYGYLRIGLWNGGKTRQLKVHRLVLLSFGVGPVSETVNHKNEVKTDNSLLNLEWKTAVENKKLSSRQGCSGSVGVLNYACKLTVAQVIEIRSSALPSNRICIKYGVNETCIRKIRQRKTWKHIK